jgi:pimeloyl-ACP methyl ester carboxylesterase
MRSFVAVSVMPACSRRFGDDVKPMDVLTARSSDGTIVGCEVIGDGPPLLVIHGSTADRHRWDSVRDLLAASFRVHLMDRRGRGLSTDEAADGYSLEREADDVRALVDAIGLPVRVLSHSYGGAVSLEAITDNPGIERLLVYEPAVSTAEGPLNAEDATREIEAAAAGGDREATVSLFYTRMLQFDDAALAAVRATPVWQHRLAAAHTLGRELRAANGCLLDPSRLEAVDIPVRVLLGTATTPALTRAAHAAVEAVPGAELKELPGHGHAAMDGDPPMFAAEVADFLG